MVPPTQMTEVSEPQTNQAAATSDSKPWTDEEDALCFALYPAWASMDADRLALSWSQRLVRAQSAQPPQARPTAEEKPPRDRGAELPWTREEEEKLHLGVAMYGARWSTITRTFFPGRTINAVRNRFNRQLRKPAAPADAQSCTSSAQAATMTNSLPFALAMPVLGNNSNGQPPPTPFPPSHLPANGLLPPPGGWSGYPQPPQGYPGYPPSALPNNPMPPGSMGPGSMGPGSMPPGSMPPGSMGPGSMGPCSMPPGSMLPGSLGPGSMGPGSMPPGSMPLSSRAPSGYTAPPGYPPPPGYSGFRGYPNGSGYPPMPTPGGMPNDTSGDANATPMPAAATAIPVNLGDVMPTAQGLPIATGSMSMTTIGASGAGATHGGEDFNDMAMISLRAGTDMPTNFILKGPQPGSSGVDNSSTNRGIQDSKEAQPGETLEALNLLGAIDSKLNNSFDKLDISGGSFSMLKMSGSHGSDALLDGGNSGGLDESSWAKFARELLGSNGQDIMEEKSTESDANNRSRSWLKGPMHLDSRDPARLD